MIRSNLIIILILLIISLYNNTGSGNSLGIEDTGATTGSSSGIEGTGGSTSDYSQYAEIRGGEPKIAYYPAAGYSPSPNDLFSIKKVVTREESAKGVGNQLRIDVEITKKDRKRTEIKDLDIYEIVDDSMQIISPADDPRAALINYKKLNSLEDIGELKDNLLRQGSYYSENAENRKVIYLEGMGPEVVVIPPGVPSPKIKLNWDNISINGSADGSDLLKLLKEDFNVKWASPETTNISSIRHKYIHNIKKEIIYVNNTKGDGDEQIQLQINSPIKKTENLEITISNLTTYNLTVENETENGNRRLLVYDWNPNLRLHVKDFSSRDRLFYWYYVKPKKSGTFNTETIVRINDESLAGSPDIIYPQLIDVFEADLRFEVKPILESSKVYANSWYSWLSLFNETLNIKYLIKFTGDASTQYRSGIKVNMSRSTDFYHYLGNEEDRLDISDKYGLFNIRIVYDKPGTYQIPGIQIEGAFYDSDKTITADTPWQRHKESITFFIAIIGFLMGLIFNKELRNGLKRPVNFFRRTPKAEIKDTAARDEAAKKMADLIIEALERGTKEKR
jgi:hypothetical protein